MTDTLFLLFYTPLSLHVIKTKEKQFKLQKNLLLLMPFYMWNSLFFVYLWV